MTRTATLLWAAVLVLLTVTACGQPLDEVTGDERTSDDDPFPTLVQSTDLPPTAFSPLPNRTGDLLVIYQPALGNVASILDREGEIRRLPGHGSDGPASWHGDLLAYLSADDSLEPDPSLAALFIYDTATDGYLEVRGSHLDPGTLYPPAFLDGGDVVVTGTGGIYRYSPETETWSLVHSLDTASLSNLTWNCNGTRLAYLHGEDLSLLRTLDLSTGVGYQVEVDGEVVDIAWSEDGRLAALTRDDVYMAVTAIFEGDQGYEAGEPIQVLFYNYTGADQLRWIPGTELVSVRVSPAFRVEGSWTPGLGGDVLVADTSTERLDLIYLAVAWHFWLDSEHLGVFSEDELCVFEIDWRQ